MTSSNTPEATASTEESEDTTATAEDQVAQAVQDVETEGEPAPEVTPEPEQPSFATVEDVRTEVGNLQGRIAQRAGVPWPIPSPWNSSMPSEIGCTKGAVLIEVLRTTGYEPVWEASSSMVGVL